MLRVYISNGKFFRELKWQMVCVKSAKMLIYNADLGLGYLLCVVFVLPLVLGCVNRHTELKETQCKWNRHNQLLSGRFSGQQKTYALALDRCHWCLRTP